MKVISRQQKRCFASEVLPHLQEGTRLTGYVCINFFISLLQGEIDFKDFPVYNTFAEKIPVPPGLYQITFYTIRDEEEEVGCVYMEVILLQGNKFK